MIIHFLLGIAASQYAEKIKNYVPYSSQWALNNSKYNSLKLDQSNTSIDQYIKDTKHSFLKIGSLNLEPLGFFNAKDINFQGSEDLPLLVIKCLDKHEFDILSVQGINRAVMKRIKVMMSERSTSDTYDFILEDFSADDPSSKSIPLVTFFRKDKLEKEFAFAIRFRDNEFYKALESRGNEYVARGFTTYNPADDYDSGLYSIFYMKYTKEVVGVANIYLKKRKIIEGDPNEKYYSDWDLFQYISFKNGLDLFLERASKTKEGVKPHLFVTGCFNIRTDMLQKSFPARVLNSSEFNVLNSIVVNESESKISSFTVKKPVFRQSNLGGGKVFTFYNYGKTHYEIYKDYDHIFHTLNMRPRFTLVHTLKYNVLGPKMVQKYLAPVGGLYELLDHEIQFPKVQEVFSDLEGKPVIDTSKYYNCKTSELEKEECTII